MISGSRLLHDGPLLASAGWAIGAGTAIVLAGGSGLVAGTSADMPSLALSCVLYGAIALAVLARAGAHHPFRSFGAANWITTIRAALTALIWGLVVAPGSTDTAWVATLLALTSVVLDGFDGRLARRSRMMSPFGARYDMEVDGALIMVLAVLTWQHGRACAWILLAGLLRCFFLAAGALWPWMRRPLPSSRRRQTTCIIQIAGLLVALVPVVPPTVAVAAAGIGLAVLCGSFLTDVVWLRRMAAEDSPTVALSSLGRAATLAAAVVLLNASLTFRNVWPTPAIQWGADLSLELLAGVIFLIVASRRVGVLSRDALRWIAAGWLLLVLGRYGDVTAPALYGRDINLYWDLRHVSGVAAMLARAMPVWLVLLVCLGTAAALMTLYGVLRWAVGEVNQAMANARTRKAMTLLATSALVLLVGQRVGGEFPGFGVATPVTAAYARQAGLAVQALALDAGLESLPESPSMQSDLAYLGRTDVLLLFMESYGAVSWDRPQFAERLTHARAALEAAIRTTNREVVSGYVTSPTFGGVSWLAHINLLSGVAVRDSGTNALLMTAKRDTLVRTFQRAGYRTVAAMPGLWQSWPEGSFYGFDEILGGERLGYRGPDFGWWSIPDQFTLARLDALEINRSSRAPLFAFFPTISTHTPFSPTPPYQRDWERVLTAEPYDASELERAYEQWPDWTNLGPGYATALEYSYTMIEGYLRTRADRDFVLILIGDHQPPAAVSGEGASWDVPVHIVARPGEVLNRLQGHGLRPGLEPSRPAVGPMHELLPVLLEAFGEGPSRPRTLQPIRTD
jgi:phosphatidylglycerophosphate synthase